MDNITNKSQFIDDKNTDNPEGAPAIARLKVNIKARVEPKPVTDGC